MIAFESCDQAKAWTSSSPEVMAKASPPFGEIRKSWATSLSLLLSLLASSASPSLELLSAVLRSERKAIHWPSGDHCGELSCPDCVSCARFPPPPPTR